MSISVAEHISFMLQSQDFVHEIRAAYDNVNGSSTDFEAPGTPIQIAASTTQSLGSTTPATAIGRLKTVTQLLIQTDNPCSLTVSFAGGAGQTIPLTSALMINELITSISVVTTTSPVNIKYVATGLLV